MPKEKKDYANDCEFAESGEKAFTVLEYRGYRVSLFNDDYGQQVFCYLDGEEIGFGSYNFNYEEDLKYLIDEKLDTIKHYDHGGKLSWFDNGYSGFRDIKLEFRSRLVKVWLISDPDRVVIDIIDSEAQEILEKLYKLYVNRD